MDEGGLGGLARMKWYGAYGDAANLNTEWTGINRFRLDSSKCLGEVVVLLK
jgi:hypothetical protein